MAVTKVYKIYGLDGHRQRESFFPSYRWDFSNDEDGTRILDVLNSDKTGTNDYTIVKVTRNTEAECDASIQGQVTDGIFENSNVGDVIEVRIPTEALKEIDFMLGSIEECNTTIKDILDRYEIDPQSYGFMSAADMPDVAMDIYLEFFDKYMLYKSYYLGDNLFFNGFDEVKRYYGHPEAEDIDELNEILSREAEGMVSPVISIVGEVRR